MKNYCRKEVEIEVILWNNSSNSNSIFTYSKEILEFSKNLQKSKIILSNYHLTTKIIDLMREKYLQNYKKGNNATMKKLLKEIEKADKKIIKEMENYFAENLFSSDQFYVQFIRGNYNLIILIPHDGNLAPNEIQDRSNGLKTRDKNTKKIGVKKKKKNLKKKYVKKKKR